MSRTKKYFAEMSGEMIKSAGDVYLAKQITLKLNFIELAKIDAIAAFLQVPRSVAVEDLLKAGVADALEGMIQEAGDLGEGEGVVNMLRVLNEEFSVRVVTHAKELGIEDPERFGNMRIGADGGLSIGVQA